MFHTLDMATIGQIVSSMMLYMGACLCNRHESKWLTNCRKSEKTPEAGFQEISRKGFQKATHKNISLSMDSTNIFDFLL